MNDSRLHSPVATDNDGATRPSMFVAVDGEQRRAALETAHDLTGLQTSSGVVAILGTRIASTGQTVTWDLRESSCPVLGAHAPAASRR